MRLTQTLCTNSTGFLNCTGSPSAWLGAGLSTQSCFQYGLIEVEAALFSLNATGAALARARPRSRKARLEA